MQWRGPADLVGVLWELPSLYYLSNPVSCLFPNSRLLLNRPNRYHLVASQNYCSLSVITNNYYGLSDITPVMAMYGRNPTQSKESDWNHEKTGKPLNSINNWKRLLKVAAWLVGQKSWDCSFLRVRKQVWCWFDGAGGISQHLQDPCPDRYTAAVCLMVMLMTQKCIHISSEPQTWGVFFNRTHTGTWILCTYWYIANCHNALDCER